MVSFRPVVRSYCGALAALLIVLGAAKTAAQPVGPEATSLQTTVTIDDRFFLPTEMSVPAGTTITWTNQGRAAHTTTSPGVWDSGPITPGATWAIRFDAPGTYDYLCTVHPAEMRGRITVDAAPTPTPRLADVGGGTRGSTNPGFGGINSVGPGLGNAGAVVARLTAQANPGVTGEASLLQVRTTTTVSVTLDSLAPNTVYTGLVHNGGCDGPILFPLESIAADATGHGRSTSTIAAPVDPSTWWIAYHANDSPLGPPIACGPVVAGD